MDDKKFWICLGLAGLGPVRTKRLLETCGTAEKIFRLSSPELAKAGIPEKIARNILEWETLPWQREMDFCERNGISVVTIQDAEYPAPLKQIFDPPSFLFIKGTLPADNSVFFSIVGTRNPSFYGIKMAEKFAEELTYCGLVIVSGMARGIDTAAHSGALKAGGRTVAVTGCGFGQCYPPENRNLSKKIEASGAVITEFLSDAPPEPGNFPRRNRIVSGLCRGVLVVEAGQKSGALITAHLALDQGREVFALPGRVDALTSKGANQLLKEGAALVETPEEIIAGLNLEVKKTPAQENKAPAGLTEREKAVFDKIAGRKKITIDELLEDAGMEQPELFGILVSLALKNLITELPGKIYTPL
ncbi:MAG: DNA-processing protein DprA [Candidatus Omnitrophica bacterium]|nr:DNA-processing protein DprA [Candidatus Omnitrophota bacterium]